MQPPSSAVSFNSVISVTCMGEISPLLLYLAAANPGWELQGFSGASVSPGCWASAATGKAYIRQSDKNRGMSNSAPDDAVIALVALA